MTTPGRSAPDGREEDAELRARIGSFTNVGHGLEQKYARRYQAAIGAVLAWHTPKMLLLQDESEWDSGGCRCGYARPCPTIRELGKVLSDVCERCPKCGNPLTPCVMDVGIEQCGLPSECGESFCYDHNQPFPFSEANGGTDV